MLKTKIAITYSQLHKLLKTKMFEITKNNNRIIIIYILDLIIIEPSHHLLAIDKYKAAQSKYLFQAKLIAAHPLIQTYMYDLLSLSLTQY